MKKIKGFIKSTEPLVFEENEEGNYTKYVYDDGLTLIMNNWNIYPTNKENHYGVKPNNKFLMDEIGTFGIDPFKHPDTERLDKLQRLTTGYGKGWKLRDSIHGRGMRLHETSQEDSFPTVREAIDAFDEREKTHKDT